jgi:hypothetical protein
MMVSTTTTMATTVATTMSMTVMMTTANDINAMKLY